MQKLSLVTLLFVVAAVYDGLLGIAFLIGSPAIFDWLQVTPPNHFGYVQFPAALLIIFALMFLAIARKPVANRTLIPYGMLLKVSYCGVAFYHWASAGIPTMWKPFAIIDLIFLALFVWAYQSLRSQRGA
jgi:hypothetical protein